jgi:hypothetical protein
MGRATDAAVGPLSRRPSDNSEGGSKKSQPATPGFRPLDLPE